MTTCKCYKCDGRGILNWASHIKNGECFACHGTGKVKCGTPAQMADVTPANHKKAKWILTATDEQIARLTYSQAHKIMDFCHCGGSLRVAYPELKATFEDRFRGTFNRLQDERLEAWRAAS